MEVQHRNVPLLGPHRTHKTHRPTQQEQIKKIRNTKKGGSSGECQADRTKRWLSRLRRSGRCTTSQSAAGSGFRFSSHSCLLGSARHYGLYILAVTLSIAAFDCEIMGLIKCKISSPTLHSSRTQGFICLVR